MRVEGSGAFTVRHHQMPEGRRTATSSSGSAATRENLHRQLTAADKAIDDLRDMLQSIRMRGQRARGPAVVGFVTGLQATPGTAATLTSTAEVNTEATFLSTRTPQWQGPGGRPIAVTGIYAGVDDGTWTFSVTSGNGRQITVTDASGATITSFQLNNNPAADQVKTIADGLTVTFKAGTTLQQGDAFSIDVKASQDGHINPDTALGGVGTASARFEEGVSITNGSFTVNGQAIAVSTSDTLTDVLNRITSQVAGVIASYDPGTERVTIQSEQTGADQTVELGNDTSGLLAALKLGGLGPATGTDPGSAPMSSVPQLATVTAGTITVNAVDIAIDPATQSLEEVLAALNAIDGVEASVDGSGRVLIAGAAGEQLTLADGGTGLFAAIGISTGTHLGRSGEHSRLSQFASRRLTAEFLQFRQALDALADNGALVGLGADLRMRMRGAIDGAVKEVEGVEDFTTMLRLDDFTIDRLASRSRTTREVSKVYGDIHQLMLGSRSQNQDGLLDTLEEIISDGLRDVADLDTRV